MTGMEILANLDKPSIYIGKVEEIYNEEDTQSSSNSDEDSKKLKEPNSIKFSIPGVVEGVVSYPIARLIGNRTRRVVKGDTVFILKQGSLNNIFFYMPMDISDFIGCAYSKDNFIKFDKENIKLKLNNTEIKITHTENPDEYNINIKNGSKGEIDIANDGTVLINGHLKVTV